MATQNTSSRYDELAGLRMSAEKFFLLDGTSSSYELLDGAAFPLPAFLPEHGETVIEIGAQLGNFAGPHRSIRVFSITHVQLSEIRVVRPDICVYLADRLPKHPRRFDTPPDLIVEVLSPGTKPLDLFTKRDDYEKFGVREYWVVEPNDGRVRCWTRRGLALVEKTVEGDSLNSEAIPGFALDLRALRDLAAE